MRAKEIRREVDTSADQRTSHNTNGGASQSRSSHALWLSYSPRLMWAVGIFLIAALFIGGLVVRNALARPASGSISGATSTQGAFRGVELRLPDSNLPAFVCASEAMGSGAANPSQVSIRALATASQTGYDRLVIEFGNGFPTSTIELRVQKGTSFTTPASGRQVALAGNNGILAVIQGAEMHTSYHGPTNFVTGYPTLKEVRLIEDLGGVVQMGLGVSGPACYRALLATNPERLVIDVKSA